MSRLQRIFYVSRRAPGTGEMDIRRLLWSARIRNRRLDITGMLLCCGDFFAQWLEGREEVLDAVMASIARDARHAELRVLRREAITLRQFSDWDLAFQDRPQLGGRIEALLLSEGEVQAQIDALARELPRPEDLQIRGRPLALQPGAGGFSGA